MRKLTIPTRGTALYRPQGFRRRTTANPCVDPDEMCYPVLADRARYFAFTILSEGNWSTEMSAATASWCSLSETSGGPTNGGNEKQMMLQMTENNTGRIRRGEIKFKLNSGGQKETYTLTVEQAPTSKIIN